MDPSNTRFSVGLSRETNIASLLILENRISSDTNTSSAVPKGKRQRWTREDRLREDPAGVN